MEEDDEFQKGKSYSGKIFTKKLSMDNWTVWNDQYLTAVARINADVETLLTYGVETNITLPKFDDKIPRLNPETGSQILDAHSDPSFRRAYPDDEDGKEEYLYQKKFQRDRKAKYNASKKQCINLLKITTEPALMDSIKLDEVKYITAYESDDILSIYQMAKFASTSQGATSIHVDVKKLLGNKPTDNNWEQYVTRFKDYRRKLFASGLNKEQILDKLIDSIFVINCDIKELEKVREDVMMEPNWLTADEYAVKWNTMIKAKRSMDPKVAKEVREGALSANSATIKEMQKHIDELHKLMTDGDPNKITAFASKFKGKTYTMTCFRCGKEGHSWKTCPHEKTLCERKGCDDYHATSQHDVIAKLRRTPQHTNGDRGAIDNSKVVPKDNGFRKRANIAEVVENHNEDMSSELEAFEDSMKGDDDLEIFNSTGAYSGLHYNVTVRKGGVPIDPGTGVIMNETIEETSHGNSLLPSMLGISDEIIYDNMDECPDEERDTELSKNIAICFDCVKDETTRKDICTTMPDDIITDSKRVTAVKITKPKRLPPKPPTVDTN